jgi:hypothetical protein
VQIGLLLVIVGSENLHLISKIDGDRFFLLLLLLLLLVVLLVTMVVVW